MAAAIVVDGLYRGYGSGRSRVDVLQSLGMNVEDGSIYGLLGPSGCGKTTLLNTLSGLDDIDSGQVLIDGVVLHDLPDDERSDYRARRMGFVFQLYNLLPVLNAVENVEMPLLVSGVGAAEARRRAMEMLELVGLTDRARHIPAQLSGGQRQRVTIARSLVNEPTIVWADEPTGDLDSETAGDIIDLMVDLNRTNGQTFVLVTHALDIGQRAHRIVRMRDGQIEADGHGSGPPVETGETPNGRGQVGA